MQRFDLLEQDHFDHRTEDRDETANEGPVIDRCEVEPVFEDVGQHRFDLDPCTFGEMFLIPLLYHFGGLSGEPSFRSRFIFLDRDVSSYKDLFAQKQYHLLLIQPEDMVDTLPDIFAQYLLFKTAAIVRREQRLADIPRDHPQHFHRAEAVRVGSHLKQFHRTLVERPVERFVMLRDGKCLLDIDLPAFKDRDRHLLQCFREVFDYGLPDCPFLKAQRFAPLEGFKLLYEYTVMFLFEVKGIAVGGENSCKDRLGGLVKSRIDSNSLMPLKPWKCLISVYHKIRVFRLYGIKEAKKSPSIRKSSILTVIYIEIEPEPERSETKKTVVFTVFLFQYR